MLSGFLTSFQIDRQSPYNKSWKSLPESFVWMDQTMFGLGAIFGPERLTDMKKGLTADILFT